MEMIQSSHIMANDTILAGNGNDTIDSGDGNDYIDGGNGDDIRVTKRYKFIQNLKILTISNQIITKKIYNFKNYKFVVWENKNDK